MSKALVILSGGQDSTTCAAIACQQFDEVHAVTFDYGQRHAIEIESAESVARSLNLASHEIISMGRVLKGSSPLVSDTQLGTYDAPEQLPGGVEPTFVPGRNLLFMTIAANRAAVLGIRDIFTGLCQADYGGYPDCEQPFVDKMSDAISQGLWGEPGLMNIHTPLMDLSKADSIKLAMQVLGDHDFRSVFALTHTCYAGDKGGCGRCHACILRDKGFRDANVDDPLWEFRQTHSTSPCGAPV